MIVELKPAVMTEKEETVFRVRAYSKWELAALYFPETVDPRVAVTNLRNLIRRNPELREELSAAHYRPRDRMFTPLQVRGIVEYLGEP